MERWKKGKQDEVWRKKTVARLETRWDRIEEHDLLMRKAATLIIGASVLDVGCGLGHFYEYAKKANPDIQYVGVDQSQDMLTQARKRYPNTTFLKKNIYELDIPKYDTVVCLDVLHHQPSLEPAFSKVYSRATQAYLVTIWIHEHYRKGKHKKQYFGQSGEFITWHSEQELEEKFKGMKYEVYRGIGYSWKNLYRFFV